MSTLTMSAGPDGLLSNLLIEDLIKIDAFYTDYREFKK
jgi:hypothetical protein